MLRRVLQASVDALVVVVGDIVPQQAVQVPLIQDNHVIQHLSTRASHPPLCDSILPGTLKGRALWFYTETPDRFRDVVREDRVIVVDQILRSGVVWECLT